MKRVLKLLIILFMIYFIIQFLFYRFGHGHNINYVITKDDKEFEIEEKLKITKDFSDGYYFNVKYGDISIPFKILDKYNREKKVITDINAYSGDIYNCISIAVKRDYNVTDIKCIRDNVIYFYNTIVGQDLKLDNLISSSNYDKSRFYNDLSSDVKDSVRYYYNNYINDQNLLLSGYKGALLFGNNVTNKARFVSLTSTDRYVKEIQAMVDKYFVVADYSSKEQDFKLFYMININTGSIDKIDTPSSISYTTFIQGIVDKKLYIVDCVNKKQYYLDVKSKTVEEIGNENKGALIYEKESWVTKNINEVIDHRITFFEEKSNEYNGINYSKVDILGNNGFIYLYKQNSDSYDVYLTYKEDDLKRNHFIFSCTDINRINYVDDYVYYIYNDEVRVFGPNIGVKNIIQYNELRFNNSLRYFVY